MSDNFRKKQYEQATPIPAKFLHADGTIDENIGGGGSSIKYKLYAYECDSVPDSFGYTEKENPIVGDVLLLPENIGSGNITDSSQLKQVFTITEVHEDGTIYAQQDESSSPIHFSRDSENDYEETITDVRDLTDISGNGLLISQKGTVFKGLNVNIEGGEVNPENLWFHGFLDKWNQLAGFITDKEVLADGVKGVFVSYNGKDPSFSAFITSAKIVVTNGLISIENLDPNKNDLPNSPYGYTGSKVRPYSINFGA